MVLSNEINDLTLFWSGTRVVLMVLINVFNDLAILGKSLNDPPFLEYSQLLARRTATYLLVSICAGGCHLGKSLNKLLAGRTATYLLVSIYRVGCGLG